MFATVMCLVLFRCTLTICSSVLCMLMVEGMGISVNVMSFLMYVMSPPPFLRDLSVRSAEYCGILDVLEDVVSFVSCMVMMSA